MKRKFKDTTGQAATSMPLKSPAKTSTNYLAQALAKVQASLMTETDEQRIASLAMLGELITEQIQGENR